MQAIILALASTGFAGQSLAIFEPARRPYDAQHYKIRMALDPSTNPDTFAGETEVRLKATAPLTTITFDIEALTIERVRMVRPAAKALKFEMKENKAVEITLPKKLKSGETMSLLLSYKGKIRSSHSGFFKVTDPNEPARGPLFFTHFEPLSARTFFPSNDEPYDKATTEILVSVPARYEVLSNGKRGKDRKFKAGKAPWHEVSWVMEKPHPTYLVSLAIGPFSKIAESYKGKEISVWVGETKVKEAKYALDTTKEALAFMESYLNVPYPWAKYAIVGLPTFLWGGMENTSSTHQNQERTVLNDPNSEFEKKRIVGLSAHELAHQWFGDYVTMQWWDDLWLNEAFASYLGTLATRHIFKNEEADLEVVVDTWDDYFRQEDGPRSHPIVDKALSSPDDAFDAINYTKGENVLRMLDFYVGEAKFREGLKGYLGAHAFGNATFLDFFKAVEKASGEDLTKFRDSWLHQKGYPVLTYGGSWDANTETYQLTLAQKSNHKGDQSIFHFRVPVTFHRKATPAYARTVALKMGQGTQTEKVALPAEPEWVSVNPGGVVLAKVIPQQHDEVILGAQALNDPDPVARVWAAYELGRSLFEGDSASSYEEKILVDLLRNDPSPYVRIAVLSGLQKMKSRWVPGRLGEALVELTKSATKKEYALSPLFLSDPHGWTEWRAEVLGTLGKVKRDETLPLLAEVLSRRDVPLDDLGKAALSVAALGDDRSGGVLKEALKLHGKRGYRYQYSIQYAYGAYESPKAAGEIRELVKTCASDLIGRMGWIIRDNQTLKTSPEWARFIQEFVLEDTRFGDEVKARIFQTIEEVKTPEVKAMLEAVATKCTSERMREIARKILDKNFASSPG